MELVVDIGNTLTKWALFEEGKIIEHGTIGPNGPLGPVFSLSKVDIIVSSVAHPPNGLVRWLTARKEALMLTPSTPLPISMEYRTPGTLGLDRLANVAAAHQYFPNETILTIDAGTCITLDLMDKGVYKGGIITLGLNMRAKALNNYTHALPLVQLSKPQQLIGKDTEQSILSGVVHGTIAEIDRTIEKFEQDLKGLKVVLTGGDLNWFEDVLKSETFADAFFTLKGLHAILQYNKS